MLALIIEKSINYLYLEEKMSILKKVYRVSTIETFIFYRNILSV